MHRLRWLFSTFLLICVVVRCESYARHFYPHPHFHKEIDKEVGKSDKTTPQYEFIAPSTTTPGNDVLVVDEHTGIKYNPFSKHHPGRHVCVTEKNVTYPVKTKQLICRPIYKKYMVRCGNQWCSGVRLVYEKYHRDVVTNKNANHYTYTCCPGWTQISNQSYGCNKPICQHPCMNGGRCVRPNQCACPPGYNGAYCETHHTQIYSPSTPTTSIIPPITYVPSCSCNNNAVCTPEGVCVCPPGFTGVRCENDIDECKLLKPCDQICYNTPGSFNCDCKENFVLMNDGQTCRREFDDGTAFEGKDMQYQMLDRRLYTLEKLMWEKKKNEVTKKDLNQLYRNIGEISNRIQDITDRIDDRVGDVGFSSKPLTRRRRTIICPGARRPCAPKPLRLCPGAASCAIGSPNKVGLLKTTKKRSIISIDKSEDEDEFIGGRKELAVRDDTLKDEYGMLLPNLAVYGNEAVAKRGSPCCNPVISCGNNGTACCDNGPACCDNGPACCDNGAACCDNSTTCCNIGPPCCHNVTSCCNNATACCNNGTSCCNTACCGCDSDCSYENDGRCSPCNGPCSPCNGACSPCNGPCSPCNGPCSPCNGACNPCNGACNPCNGPCSPCNGPCSPCNGTIRCANNCCVYYCDNGSPCSSAKSSAACLGQRNASRPCSGRKRSLSADQRCVYRAPPMIDCSVPVDCTCDDIGDRKERRKRRRSCRRRNCGDSAHKTRNCRACGKDIIRR